MAPVPQAASGPAPFGSAHSAPAWGQPAPWPNMKVSPGAGQLGGEGGGGEFTLGTGEQQQQQQGGQGGLLARRKFKAKRKGPGR